MVRQRFKRAFLRSPRRAAVTAVPIVAEELIRMKVMRAMKGIEKTRLVSGQGTGLAIRKYP
jgi:hypothetical protein